MEQEHQQVEQLDQQSISLSDQDTSTSISSFGSSAPTDGGDGSDPHEQGRYFRHLSDTSIQAQEAAHWQEMANNSPQAQHGALLKDGAAHTANGDSPITVPEETGIPKNMQFSIEYMAKVSLKDVRVHYDSERATEQGVAIFHEDTNVYVAPGQEEQLGEELWKVAEELKQGQGGSEPVDNTLETAPIPSRLKAPVTGTSITHEPLGSSKTDDSGMGEDVLEQQNETDQTVIGSTPNLDGLPTDVEPTGEEYKDERPKPITPKPLPTSSTDQGFQAVKTAIGTEGDKQQQHKSTTKQVEDAHKAAAEPANKKSSVAQNQHLGVIEEKETPAFETNAFVEALMARVLQIMPKDKEEADNFKSSGKVAEVKSAVSGTVSSAKQQSIGPLDQVTKQEPSTAGIASKQVTPLPRAATGQNPADIQAQKAMPKPLDKDRVEQPLQNNSKALDQQMLSNKMTDEQLQNSNEPTFQAALESKNTAKQDSEDKVTQARQEEQQQRQQNQQEANTLGQQQMGAIHQDRVAVMTNVHGQQQTASTNYTAEEKAVADKINGIFATAKVDVDKRLSRLDARVQQLFDNGAASAQRQFEAYVERRLTAYKEKRYEGISGKVSWLSDAFTGLPDEVNAFFVEGRDLYIRLMKRTIQDIARLVARELTAAKKRVQQGRQEVATYVESLPDNLRKVGKQAADEINKKFDELNSTVDAKQEELIDSLATKYAENLKAVDDRIEQLKAENKGLVDAAFEQLQGAWEAIQQVKAMITGALHAAASAIDAILQDPIGFLSNLIDGVGQGFNNFLEGIQQNLTTGFVTWLTGQLSSRGIQMPEDIFSLEGIFSITTQALNLTWEALRERAVGVLGEKAVGTIEEGFEIFQIIKQDGMAGAWEHIKEQFTDLKETIMDSMVGMIIQEVVEAGIVSILALLTPAGAFVKAALMIVDIAKFFINQGSQLVELVNAFSASILAIANGNVGQVAKSIERALVISIPVLIGFLAALIKLGDVAAKVQKIFRKLTGRINKVIDDFIEKAGAWFNDKKGRRKAKRDKKKAEKDKKKGDEDGKENPKDKAKVDKGLRLGAAVVNNENLTKEQINVELKQIEQKEKLKDLDAKLVEETEQWHTYMLKAKAGSSKKEKRIKRKPTKATNEEEVSEADRQLHQKIAAQVKARLEAKGKSTEGVETFEEFYGILKTEAAVLQREFQPQLRNGIKITIDLINQVQQDKKDGDVDIKVKIAPNTVENYISIQAVDLVRDSVKLSALSKDIKNAFSTKKLILKQELDAKINELTRQSYGNTTLTNIKNALQQPSTSPQLYSYDNKRYSYHTTDDLDKDFGIHLSSYNSTRNSVLFTSQELQDQALAYYGSKQKRFWDTVRKRLLSVPIIYSNGGNGTSLRYALDENEFDSSTTDYQQLARDYDQLIRELGLSPTLAPWHGKPASYTVDKNDTDKCRRAIREKILSTPAYSQDINTLNNEVLQKDITFPSNKLRGEIFEQWLNQRGSTLGQYSKHPTFFQRDYPFIQKTKRQADGYSGTTLLEAKVSKDVAGRGPSSDERKQMEDYAGLLDAGASWKPNLNTPPIVFNHVKYTFNDENTMNKWFVTGPGTPGQGIFKSTNEVSWETP